MYTHFEYTVQILINHRFISFLNDEKEATKEING